MTRMTHALIRRKSEHNDGCLPDLEEISLHQLEIERIEAINDCRKLKILLLQNNIIQVIENVNHLKDLEYLNLALNNIVRIENLRGCEFLKKLDLTVNFIELDDLEASVDELTYNHHLAELYLLGNPAADWEGCKDYISARLPSVTNLDGRRITPTQRIQALQRLPALTAELHERTAASRAVRAEAAAAKAVAEAARRGPRIVEIVMDDGDDDDAPRIEDVDEEAEAAEAAAPIPWDVPCDYTPEGRLEMYREIAEEKQEKEDREKRMRPRERNYSKEHFAAVARIREEERAYDAGTSARAKKGLKINQCNQGQTPFHFREDKEKIYVDIEIPKFLDTSLVDVDVQPNRISVVIKGKLIRLCLPEEVEPEAANAKRSKATSMLTLELPKLVQAGPLTYGVDASGLMPGESWSEATSAAGRAPIDVYGKYGKGRSKKPKQKLGDAILAASGAATKRAESHAVAIGGIVGSGSGSRGGAARGGGGGAAAAKKSSFVMEARRTRKVHDAAAEAGCPALE